MQNRRNFLLALLITFSTITNISANALTQYRLHGIQNIEKKMDMDLSNKLYWNTYLKDVDTRFGYLEAYRNILYCDKSQSTLSLYIKGKNNLYTPIKDYSAFTGKMKGDKIKEGDLRTPVGVYTLTKKLNKVDSFYGPMAFVTSYPNSYDIYKGKGGHGIWIHGLPTEEKRDSFTKGCIAINNKNIKCLDKNININETVLIISEGGIQDKVSKDTLSEVLSQLYAWRYAWIYNNIDVYLDFYDPSFKRFDGVGIENFSRYKHRVFAKDEKKSIRFTQLNVIPYPGTVNMFKVTFHEIYNSSSFSFSGDKVLIVKLIGTKVKIITEK